jgi:2-amino-4-hydroxy-6-hydroxymethyldihydropteridine diphosphokinase
MTAEPSDQHVTFLSLGSNLNDKRLHLAAAIEQLRARMRIEDISPIYATEPVDFKDQDWFLNQVLKASTTLTPRQLLNCCLSIERSLGRERRVPKGPRTIDIDVLFFNDEIIKTDDLQIPHPRLHLRRFVLEPLVLLAPDWVHPGLNESVAALLGKCPDSSRVIVVDE